MRVIIESDDLPGAAFVSEGVALSNVHVGVQVGSEPVGLVRGDAESARWSVEVRPVVDDSGIDLRGPAVHGKKGDRFFYLTWGNVDADGSFAMFRRAKLMLADIDPGLAGCDGTR